MNALATVIASYGLFANSPAVVIGAMVVAMLLGPITATALALVEGNNKLLRKAAFTATTGTAIVYIVALIIGFAHKNIPITNEIMARTAPNFVDLMIALAGGAAGAYALISPRIGLSLVGVAIATALVPPLASSAILLTHGEFALAGGALLLAFTNIVGIQFASSVVIWLFRRNIKSLHQVDAKQAMMRNAASIVILIILGVILTVNMRYLVKDQAYRVATRSAVRREIEKFKGSYLTDIHFEKVGNTTIIRAVVMGPRQIAPKDVAAVEAKLLGPDDGQRTDFRVRFIKTTVVTSRGMLYKDGGEMDVFGAP